METEIISGGRQWTEAHVEKTRKLIARALEAGGETGTVDDVLGLVEDSDVVIWQHMSPDDLPDAVMVFFVRQAFPFSEREIVCWLVAGENAATWQDEAEALLESAGRIAGATRIVAYALPFITERAKRWGYVHTHDVISRPIHTGPTQ